MTVHSRLCDKLTRGEYSNPLVTAKAGTQARAYWIRAFGLRGEDSQSKNRLETDSSAAVRLIASPIRCAMGSTRMLGEAFTSAVG
jgi:hypothetical protein